MAIPVLETLEITGKTLTADALLTQRKLASYVVERGAHYLFTVKDNQPTLSADIRLHFAERGERDFREPLTLQHGRLETRAIWTSTALNDYVDFPPRRASLRHRAAHDREKEVWYSPSES
jgi:hypothetical protein